MALNQILDRSASTVVVSGDTGALANGRDVVTITVTAIDTSGDPIPNAEVFIEETSGNHFLSDSEMPQDPGGDGRLRGPDPVETDANGVGAVTLTSFHEGTLTFDVFVGAPQGGTGGASGAAVFNGNNVDDGGVYTQKTLAADVGASGGYTTTYNTDQTIDAAWLVANNGGSTSIQNTRFQNCTVTVTTEVQFNNCLFEGGSNDYALVVNLDSLALTDSLPTNYLLQDCTITGGAEAGLTGYRIHMIDCLIEECGKHGIKLTKRSGTGNEPVQIVRSVVRKVGDGGSSVAPQGYGVYAVDARYVTLRGISVECPYHTTGGAIAGYYPEGAVYVGADTDPISHFFFYTSWIDGGVKLDDAGLGIGPEGQMFSPNMYGRNYNPAVPLFDTTDVPSLWTKGQMWMDTGALISNEEAGGNIRTFTGKKYNNLWASGAALDTQATFTLDPAYSLVTLDAFDQFGPFTTNLLDFPPRNNSFGQWTPATINSSPVPTVLAETPLPLPQTGTADRISYNNSAAFADGALVRSKEVGINAGDTVPYEVTVAAANGDGFKTLMALKDDSDQIIEQATVVFSNVLARAGTGQQLLTVDDGVENLLTEAGYGEFSDLTLSAGASIATSPIAAPDGTLTAVDVTSASAITLSQDILDTDFGAAWNDAVTWTASWYVYTPSLATSADFVVALLNGATVQESATVTIDSDGDITSFTGVTQGSPSLSAERNIYAQSIGETGWVKYQISLHDNGTASDRVRFIPINASSASNTYTLWNPTLRYGDWVSRGKNKADSSLTDLLAYPSGSQAPSVSSVLAPDGTASAVDLWASSGGYYPQRTMMPSSEYVTGGRYTAEFYIKHPLPSRADIVNYGVRVELIVSAGTSEIIRPILARNGGIVSVVTSATAGPGYTLDDTESLQITDDGWWRYRIYAQHYDTANPITSSFFWWLLYDDTDEPVTIWNPRLTVGNPADARGYFVSGPQNLLGDGSDYSGWTAGVH